MTPQAQLQVEDLGDHRYQVHLDPHDSADGPVEVVIQARPAVLARFASDRCSETAVVAGTVAYLLTHQNPEDLPAQVDLEDVAAAYDDFPAELRRWLDSSGPTPSGEGRSHS